jgi:uncharacterized membrane protein YfbV (UPF0208 family)
VEPPQPRPVRIVVTDDLLRSRVTVIFRLILAIPHLIWLLLWSIGAVIVAIVNWFATLVRGVSPDGLHEFLATYLRYWTHVVAYVSLAAEPWPDFLARRGYPVDLEVDPPRVQNRWTVGFRLVLAVPALVLAEVFLSTGGGGGWNASTGRGQNWAFSWGGGGLIAAVAFFGWFVCVARARVPNGFRDVLVYAIRYAAEAYGYVFLLSGRYPDSDPATAVPGPAPPHPVRIEVADDLVRSRLTVLFRFLLALPHLVWLTLWAVAAILAGIANWFATLVRGTPPDAFQRFLSAFIRYDTHVFAFIGLTANPFPGFVGRRGSYPVDVDFPAPARQNRWTVGFRFFLAIPALVLSAALGATIGVTAFFGWFYALATGHTPRGYRNLQAFALRYSAQANAYLYLITQRYPHTGPPAEGPPVGFEPAGESALAA